MPTATSPTSEQPTRYAGLGDGFTRAFEIALTPALFCGFGYLTDGLAGTRPVFMIGFTVFAVVGMFLRLWYVYDATMVTEQAKAVAARVEAERLHDESVRSPTFEIETFDTGGLSLRSSVV